MASKNKKQQPSQPTPQLEQIAEKTGFSLDYLNNMTSNKKEKRKELGLVCVSLLGINPDEVSNKKKDRLGKIMQKVIRSVVKNNEIKEKVAVNAD